jgi:hypothetical protein
MQGRQAAATNKRSFMNFEFKRLALIGGLSVVLCAAALGQHAKVNSNPPANPQAKSTQPATHFTQGTITSIGANEVVITRKVRGKAEQAKFNISSQTQRNGNLATGTRVSVQYRDHNGQNIAAAVRELTVATTAKPSKTKSKG